MDSFLAEILAGINENDDEAILGACEYADAFHVGGFTPVPPYDERLGSEPPTAEGLAQIKEALLANLKSITQPNPRVYVALGKCRDPALVPLLREHLAQNLKALLRYNGALASLVMALSYTGEGIISEHTHSPFEPNKLIADTRAYLKQFGLTFPW